MKTTQQIIDELNKYPLDIKWSVIIDDDEGGMLISEYTGITGMYQVAINIEREDEI